MIPRIGEQAKFVFLPNLHVEPCGGLIHPAAESLEQISTSGCRPRGTGNMKARLSNGALTNSAYARGANVEIARPVGPSENIHDLFGLTLRKVAALCAMRGYCESFHAGPFKRGFARALYEIETGSVLAGFEAAPLFIPTEASPGREPLHLIAADFDAIIGRHARSGRHSGGRPVRMDAAQGDP